MKLSATNHSKKFRINNKTAASLAEILIAVAILSISVVSIIGTMLIAQKGSRLTRDRLIASNLAREGIEIVRSIRDSNWIKCSQDKTKWFVIGVCNGASYTNDNAPGKHKRAWFNTGTEKWELSNYNLENTFDANYELKIITYGTADLLTYSSLETPPKSRFYRKIKLQFETNDPTTSSYVLVTSTVGWTDSSGLQQDIEVKEQLLNLQ